MDMRLPSSVHMYVILYGCTLLLVDVFTPTPLSLCPLHACVGVRATVRVCVRMDLRECVFQREPKQSVDSLQHLAARLQRGAAPRVCLSTRTHASRWTARCESPPARREGEARPAQPSRAGSTAGWLPRADGTARADGHGPSRVGVGPSRLRASLDRMDVAEPDCAPVSQRRRRRRRRHTLYLYARRHAWLRRDSLLRAVGAFGRHPEGGHGGSRGARPPWEGVEPTDGWSVTERTVESAPRWANSSTVWAAPSRGRLPWTRSLGILRRRGRCGSRRSADGNNSQMTPAP